MNASDFYKRHSDGVSLSRMADLAADAIEMAKAAKATNVKEAAQVILQARLVRLGKKVDPLVIDYAVECSMVGKQLPMDALPADEPVLKA